MKIVSAICHPLLIATYLSALLLFQSPELFPRIRPEVRLQLLLVIFLITTVLPAFSVFLLRTFKYISNLELTNRKERIAPFTFILFYYAAAAYLFTIKLEIGTLITLVMVSVSILILILLLITPWFKISIHAAAMWGGVGYITGIILTYNVSYGSLYYLIVFAAGLTCTSRLYLSYHSPKQIWAGSIFGFIYSFLIIFVGIRIL